MIDIVFGGCGGDEGKGLISGFLSLNGDYCAVIRDCSPQAGHTNLIHGKRIGLAHLPGGVVNPDMNLFLAGGSLISVERLLKEMEQTGMNPKKLHIDPRAIIVTEEHRQEERANQSLMGKTGSVGTGAGPARRDKVMRSPKVIFARDVSELQQYLTDTREEIYSLISKGGDVLLECDHSSKLDLTWGDWPVVTSKNTNPCQFLSDCGFGPKYARNVIMVMKPYTTMVAKAGREKLEKPIYDENLLDWAHDKGGEVGTVSGRQRNLGEVEWNNLEKVVKYEGVTRIAITHLDFPRFKGATKENLTPEAREFLEEVGTKLCSQGLGPKIYLLSFGQSVDDVVYY